jgi:glucose-6-phosphate 1-dehydrogenase
MPPTTTLVIFGASGDLTRRKLVPALYRLHRKRRLPDGFRLLGMARSLESPQAFRADLATALQTFAPDPFDPAAWEDFSERIDALRGDPAEPGSLHALDQHLRQTETAAGGHAQRLYYLAIPPHAYADVITALGQAGMVTQDDGWRRVVIEKPFGRDLATARELNLATHRALAENQVYRIDHYLGKETVQNILVFRFANSVFEPIWNRNYIDHVQITAAESVGVEHRGSFYDGVGVLRDIFQNHLLQVLAVAAMEPPTSFQADALRDERAKVLRAVRAWEPHEAALHTVRGQYEGYRQEAGVRPDSQTETFAALRLWIDNWRWQGVPFYLRSGKALAEKATGITIQFKSVPHVMFPLPPGQAIRPNTLSLCLQPDEGMHLQFEVKVPDTLIEMRSADMEFHYDEVFGPDALPDAYERLLLDALTGDASLFARADSIELAWGLIDPLLNAFESTGAPPLARYARGSWGPAEADALLATDGRTWRNACRHHADPHKAPPGE